MNDPKADILAQAAEAGVTLDDAMLEWMDRMSAQYDDVYFELWTPAEEVPS